MPPLFTIFVISIFYNALRANPIVSAVLKGMQAGACAVIFDVVSSLFVSVMKDKGSRILVKSSIMVGAFVSAFILKINFIAIVLFFIALGVIWFFASRERRVS
jgi:chromate transporter